jgi:hypothetical protein
MVFAKPQLFSGGNHSVGHVPVGLSGTDRERSREHGARERHDNAVADKKIVSTTHNPADCGSITMVLLGNFDLTPPNGFAVGLWLLHKLEHLPHNDGALESKTVNGFFFKSNGYECLVDTFRGDVVWKVHIFAKPREGDAHHTTIPNC